MSRVTVADGDCLLSLSAEHGLDPVAVWEHAGNAELREIRPNPMALRPGDELFLPEPEPGTRNVASSARHVFVLRRSLVRVRLRLLEPTDDEPSSFDDQGVGPEPVYGSEAIGGIRFIVEVEGDRVGEGETGGDGMIDVQVPATARTATVRLEPDTDRERLFEISLGSLEPESTIRGAKQRLHNLGFDAGPVDDEDTDLYRFVLAEFQGLHGLTETGELDAATISKLVDVHGS